MKQLNFKKSMSTCHKIVTDLSGKKYLMDTSTISPNIYGFGFLPKKISVKMVELDKNSRNIEQKERKSSKFTGIAVATQPLTTIMYRMFKQLFLDFNIHQQFLLKCFMFLVSVFFGLLLAKVYILIARKKISDRLPSNPKKFTAIFSFTGKRDYSSWYGVGLIFIFFIFFITLNNGTEGILLVPITLISYLFFLFWLGMSPIYYDYESDRIILEKIEEVE